MGTTKTAGTKDSQSPTFETVWAILQETARGHKETDRIVKELSASQKETDRLIKEVSASQKETSASQKETRQLIKEVFASQKETYKQIEETARQMKETDKQVKDANKRFGDFTNRFGEVVEYMIAPNLCEKFKKFGLNFSKYNSGTIVTDYVNNIHFEIDICLENYEKAMLVEVKTKLGTGHIKDHIARLEKMRKYADLHGDKRSFLGAVAGVVMTPNAKNYALSRGLFVVEPSGETLNIIPPDSKPKEW